MFNTFSLKLSASFKLVISSNKNFILLSRFILVTNYGAALMNHRRPGWNFAARTPATPWLSLIWVSCLKILIVLLPSAWTDVSQWCDLLLDCHLTDKNMARSLCRFPFFDLTCINIIFQSPYFAEKQNVMENVSLLSMHRIQRAAERRSAGSENLPSGFQHVVLRRGRWVWL